MTPDYILGFQLASASDTILKTVLAERPATLALIRQLNQIVPGPNLSGPLDAFLNPVPRPNHNRIALARIVPPPMPLCYRYGSVNRLRRMQGELGAGNEGSK